MNYYEESDSKIAELIKNKKYDEAKALIYNELNVAYVPKNFKEKLIHYIQEIKADTYKEFSLNRDEIEKYLFSDEEKQLIAVEYLHKENLRDYVDMIEDYFKNNPFKNAVSLLIDSLINQEVNHKFSYSEQTFNPSKMEKIVDNETYKNVLNMLNEYYYKDPSKLSIAIDLLNKYFLLNLPSYLAKENSNVLKNKIIEYIEKAFKC